MTDYDETRARRKTSYAPPAVKPRVTYYDCKCVKCGMEYMKTYLPESVIHDGGLTPPYKFTCDKCLPSAPKYAPSPPPRSMQISIEEKYGAKK